MIRILSLGAGVQSTTVLLMSLKGELPRIDHAIFADTGWEPREVYDHLDCLELECIKAGVPLHRVSTGNIRRDALAWAKEGKRWASMPVYIRGEYDSIGTLHRECTIDYKVKPIDDFIKSEILHVQVKGKTPRTPVVEKWFGISIDESQRMRTPTVKWCKHYYPLCGYPLDLLPKSYSRADCLEWLSKHWSYEVPKSACLGCPYHSNAEWRRIKAKPDQWADVVQFDREIRESVMTHGDVYLHRSIRPLGEVDLSTAEDKGQLNMFNNECQGMCGV